jgi:hypothetical protein
MLLARATMFDPPLKSDGDAFGHRVCRCGEPSPATTSPITATVCPAASNVSPDRLRTVSFKSSRLPMPQLNVLSISAAIKPPCCASHANTGGNGHVQLDIDAKADIVRGVL